MTPEERAIVVLSIQKTEAKLQAEADEARLQQLISFQINEAVAAEREACAKICDDLDAEYIKHTRRGDKEMSKYPGNKVARAAFDVMMRRGWTLQRRLVNGAFSEWYVMESDDPDACGVTAGNVDCWPDPFTAIVEADAWYRENVEKQE